MAPVPPRAARYPRHRRSRLLVRQRVHVAWRSKVAVFQINGVGTIEAHPFAIVDGNSAGKVTDEIELEGRSMIEEPPDGHIRRGSDSNKQATAHWSPYAGKGAKAGRGIDVAHPM